MKPRPLPCHGFLKECFDYNRSTGDLTWKMRPKGHFASPKEWLRWNGRHAGKPALTSVGGSTYRNGSLCGRSVLAHRVVWKLVTGEEPDTIDHKNGDRLDNSFSNLRSVPLKENHKNKRRLKEDRDLPFGVFKYGNKWKAQIRSDKKDYSLGVYDTVESAIAARKEAEKRFGFHKNHGAGQTKRRT